MSHRFDHRKFNAQKPKTLKGKDIPSIAKYIKSNECQNIFLMLGAGISTSAGIPDFRSPETGLYSNLARLNLPHPEAVFEIGFFRRNPVPFYTLAHELYPGKFRPTITHSFIRLLAEKSLLGTCFTQNIDTLERRAGVPDAKIIEAHGSFASQRCINCKREFDDEKMKKHINEKKIAKCEHCGGYVKPDIVFFGEDLPLNFINSLPKLREADLLIVMGTSLTVHPFASLAGLVDNSCPRILINLDHVGDFGSRSDDVILLGKCDDVVRDLCKELGWEEELIKLWNATEDTVSSDAQVDATESTRAEAEAEMPKSATEATRKPEKGVRVPDALEKIEEQLALLDLGVKAEQPTAITESTDKLPTTAASVPLSASLTAVDTVSTSDKAGPTSSRPPADTPSEKKADTDTLQTTLATDNKL